MVSKQLYTIYTDPLKMDLDVVHSFLTESYWSPGIPKAVVAKAIKNSICFGAFDSEENQVGFARAVTDKATFSYLADVFVLETHRGEGVAKLLMDAYTKHPDLQGIRRHMLATSDAHKLYEKYGFTPIDQPEIFMQKHNPDVHKN